MDRDRLGNARSCFFQGQYCFTADVRTTSLSWSTTAASEETTKQAASEDISKGLEDIIDRPELYAPSIEAGTAKLVKPGPLLLVAQDLIRLGCFLEASNGVLIIRITVGMVLECLLAIGAVDVILGCVVRNPEDLVIITIGHNPDVHLERGWKKSHLGKEMAWKGTGNEQSRPTGHAKISAGNQETLPSTRCFSLSSLSKFVTSASVVSINPAMLAAFFRAVLTTFTGSITPALNRSQ